MSLCARACSIEKRGVRSLVADEDAGTGIVPVQKPTEFVGR
jgi:hypothetical protein